LKKKIKFELASQDKVKKMRTYMHKIVTALGHSEALVTDESMVSDFLDIFDKEERTKQIKKAKKKIKVDICPGDYLWEVAERMIK
jgi:hypothetical protein